MSDGYVYVIAFSDGTVKVGRTQKFGPRMIRHRANARNFGLSVTGSWISAPHAEWLANEDALKLIAADIEALP